MTFDRPRQRSVGAPVENCPLVSVISGLVAPLRHGSRARHPHIASQAVQRALSAAVRAEGEIATLRQRVTELECLVITDELTGVLNRRGFEMELRRTLDLAQRHGETGVLLFVDLDEFKRVNDTYGHDAGDEVLRRIALLLKRSVRLSDVVARVGSDEFVVLLTNACAIGGMRRKAVIEQSLRAAVVRWRDRVIRIGASVGARSYGPCDECDALIREADERMYAQKSGRPTRDSRSRAARSHRPAVAVSACTAGTIAS